MINTQGGGPESGAAPLLSVDNVAKYFGGVRALDGVSFKAREGEVVGIVGDNGAGKSTLFKILSGVLEADSCTYRIDGKPVEVRSVADANSFGIYTVYQDLALCDNLDTTSNLFLGAELRRPFWQAAILDKAAMEHRSQDVLRSLGVKIRSLATPVGRLSGGQRQSVAIARAVLRNPRLILLDEPTASLGVEQTAQVLDLIRRLRTEGRAIALISHNLYDVLAVADRVVVLRLGRVARVFERPPFDVDHIVAAITGASEVGGVRVAERPNGAVDE